MTKSIFTKVFSVVIVLGMLLTAFPLTAQAENASPQSVDPNATITLTGKVRDGGIQGGAKHGYPLMATLTFTSGATTKTAKSDPLTGDYSIELDNALSYEVTVETQHEGYKATNAQLASGFTSPQNFDLYINEALCSAPGYEGSGGGTGFTETFDTPNVPAGWTVMDYGANTYIWKFNDPAGRGNLTGGTGFFATVDSFSLPDTALPDTGLRTPVLNFAGRESVSLKFLSHYRQSGTVAASIRVSTDGGSTWEIAYDMPTDNANQPKPMNIDLSTHLANESNAMIEFLYTGKWGFWWQIDNVEIPGGSCNRLDGGVAAGYVLDANNNNAKLIGAKVKTAANETITATDTFEPAKGLYWFFEKTNYDDATVAFTVSKPGYGTVVEDVSISQHGVRHHDFHLGLPSFVIDPTSLEETMALDDEHKTQTIYLENQGTVAGTFKLYEHDKGHQPVAPRELNIPAFTGTLPERTEPVTDRPKPAADSAVKAADLGFKIELDSNAAAYGIKEVVPAYAMNVMTHPADFYKFPNAGNPGAWQRIGPGTQYAFAGDFLGSDFSKFYFVDVDVFENVLYTLDTATGAIEHVKTLTGLTGDVNGIAGANGFFYGVDVNCGENSRLFKMTPAGDITILGEIAEGKCPIDVAYVPSENRVYTVDLAEVVLMSMDPARPGAAVKVGTGLGYPAAHAQGMDYDEANGIMYWAACSQEDSQLRIIDLKSGGSVKVGEFLSDEVDAFAVAAYTGGASDVPWLSTDYTQGTVAPGERFPIEVTFSAKNVLNQPGDYFAELHVLVDKVTPVTPVPVTLHVTRPETWGAITGLITATERCDRNPAPLAGATVTIFKDGGLVTTTTSNAEGKYSVTLPAGTYDIEVEHADFIGARTEGIGLPENGDVTADLRLRFDAACVTFEPGLYFAMAPLGGKVQQLLTLKNTGTKDIDIEIEEVPGEGPVPFAMEDVVLKLDDGTMENALGVGGQDQFIALNRFTPGETQFPFVLQQIQIYIGDSPSGARTGDPIAIYVYQNKSGNANPSEGAEFLYGQMAKVGAQEAWTTIDLEEPITFEGPGDVLIAVGFLKKPGASYFPASLDQSESQGRSWIGFWETDIPEVPVLPPNGGFAKIDGIGEEYAGNWMIRGLGEVGTNLPGDIPWLTLDATTGTLAKNGGEMQVVGTFDSENLSIGDYFAQLRITNQPFPRVFVPVQFRVVEAVYQLHLPIR